WANILYQYYWNLVDKLGFTEDTYSADITKGNTLALKLIVDGLKLQPCNPTFVSARDAILQAEQQATGGKHKCEIWRAFALRGVGAKAASTGTKVTEDFSLPADCA
ncbi:peptidase M36, partial [Thamnocephalis sphaerospora]